MSYLPNKFESNPYENKPLASINAYAAEVKAEEAKQEVAYKAAQDEFSVWAKARADAFSKYLQLKTAYTNKNRNNDNYELRNALANYNTVCSSYSGAETNLDIRRGAYTDCIFYSHNIQTQATIANYICG